MKKNTTIQVNNNWNEKVSLTAKFIGRGFFAKCYHAEDGRVYSFVSSDCKEVDYSKSAISEWTDESNPYIPRITVNGDYDNGRDYGIIYSMPFYNKLTAKHKTAWKQYKYIMQAWYSSVVGMRNNLSEYETNCKFIERIQQEAILPEALIEAFESINTACTNYGSDYSFDFGKVNFSVDENGNLILRDIICNATAARNIKRGTNK